MAKKELITSYAKYADLAEKKGVSTYEVCSQLGIAQSTIANWKKGESDLNISTLNALAGYFNVSIEHFLKT